MDRKAIKEAIKCEDWQDFRRYLKGKATKDKLVELKGYLEYRPNDCVRCGRGTREIQVHNYLNALARGGLIEALIDSTSQLTRGEIVVRR